MTGLATPLKFEVMTYKVLMKCVGKERPQAHLVGEGHKQRQIFYMPKEYKAAIKEFRKQLIEQGIPDKPVPRLRSTGTRRPAKRNVRLDAVIKFEGYSSIDKDNAEGFIADAIQREVNKKTEKVVFAGIIEDDWQIWDGRTQLLMYQGVNEISFQVILTEEPLPDIIQLGLWETNDG